MLKADYIANPNMANEALVQELYEIFLEEFGKDLSKKDVNEIADMLIALFDTLIKVQTEK